MLSFVRGLTGQAWGTILADPFTFLIIGLGVRKGSSIPDHGNRVPNKE